MCQDDDSDSDEYTHSHVSLARTAIRLRVKHDVSPLGECLSTLWEPPPLDHPPKPRFSPNTSYVRFMEIKMKVCLVVCMCVCVCVFNTCISICVQHIAWM